MTAPWAISRATTAPTPEWGTVSDWLTAVGLAVTVVGLLVSLYTLSRVQTVAKAQEKARADTEDLLGIDDVEIDIASVINALAGSTDAELTTLASQLTGRLGRIQGVRYAVSGRRPPSERHRAFLLDGFFSEDFMRDSIRGAKEELDIVTGRLRVVSSWHMMREIEKACERGVAVRIIGISARASDDTLRDAAQTVSSPPPQNADEYRQHVTEVYQQILENVRGWSSADAQRRFALRCSTDVPRVSMVRSDSKMRVGFLQFYRVAQPAQPEDRQYLELTSTSPTGLVAGRHFDAVWDAAEHLWPVPERSEEIRDNAEEQLA